MIDEEAVMLPAKRAAELFGITLRSLSNWERAGVLTPRRIRGRRYYLTTEVQNVAQGGQQRYARKLRLYSDLKA